MTKVIIQTYPTVGNLEEMAKYRPIGRNTEMFQRLLEEMRALAVAADDLGYWGISHTEHHFHSEGVELSLILACIICGLALRRSGFIMGSWGMCCPRMTQ